MTGLQLLGPALRRLRERRSMQQIDMVERAKELGHRLERARISDWELGKKEPTLRSLFVYLEVLDFRLSDLEQQLRELEFAEISTAESAERDLSSDAELRSAMERLEGLLAGFREEQETGTG